MNLTFYHTMKNMKFKHTLLSNPLYLCIYQQTTIYLGIYLTGLHNSQASLHFKREPHASAITGRTRPNRSGKLGHF